MPRDLAAQFFAPLMVFVLATTSLAQTTPVPVPPILFPVTQGAQWEDTFGAPRAGHTHLGQDLMAPKMRPLIACFAGTVTLHSNRGSAGNWITLHGTGDAAGWRAEYMHLNNDMPGTNDGLGGDRYAFAPGLKSGDSVLAGQFLGYVGNSGNAEDTGCHCHFELHGPEGPVNCAILLRAARILPAPQPMQTRATEPTVPTVPTVPTLSTPPAVSAGAVGTVGVAEPVASSVIGTVIAVFPEQGEALVRVTGIISSGGTPTPLDPPRTKRLFFRDRETLATLARNVLLSAEGKDQGPGKPLQVERLTTLGSDTDTADSSSNSREKADGRTFGESPFVLFADGTRTEGTRLLTMETTSYGPGDNGRWGDRTASGTKVGYGTVAVDPAVIPLGTHLWIEGYGFCVALDTGSTVKGMKIDLGQDSDKEAAAIGRKKRRVLILD